MSGACPELEVEPEAQIQLSISADQARKLTERAHTEVRGKKQLIELLEQIKTAVEVQIEMAIVAGVRRTEVLMHNLPKFRDAPTAMRGEAIELLLRALIGRGFETSLSVTEITVKIKW